MAIFASTTLGSSDPSKAMNIKALEARAQALAAAQANRKSRRACRAPGRAPATSSIRPPTLLPPNGLTGRRSSSAVILPI